MRYKQIDFLKVSEVETEIDTLIEIIGDRMPTDEETKYITDLMGIAKALGTKRSWQLATPPPRGCGAAQGADYSISNYDCQAFLPSFLEKVFYFFWACRLQNVGGVCQTLGIERGK